MQRTAYIQVCAVLQGSVGTVGFPLPNVQLRLESVPEMNYDALGLPARGEVCLRGPTVFPGYYKADVRALCCISHQHQRLGVDLMTAILIA